MTWYFDPPKQPTPQQHSKRSKTSHSCSNAQTYSWYTRDDPIFSTLQSTYLQQAHHVWQQWMLWHVVVVRDALLLWFPTFSRSDILTYQQRHKRAVFTIWQGLERSSQRVRVIMTLTSMPISQNSNLPTSCANLFINAFALKLFGWCFEI